MPELSAEILFTSSDFFELSIKLSCCFNQIFSSKDLSFLDSIIRAISSNFLTHFKELLTLSTCESIMIAISSLVFKWFISTIDCIDSGIFPLVCDISIIIFDAKSDPPTFSAITLSKRSISLS